MQSPAVRAICCQRNLDDGLIQEKIDSYLDASFIWSLDRAAFEGHLWLIKRLNARFPKKYSYCSEEAMDSAAEQGFLPIVQFLHENRKEGCTTDALDQACGHGHLHVVQWLIENRLEGCTVNAADMASANGHLDVLQCLKRAGIGQFGEDALPNAAGHGRIAVLEWLHEECELPICARAIRNAISASQEAALRWLLDRSTIHLINEGLLFSWYGSPSNISNIISEYRQRYLLSSDDEEEELEAFK